MPVKSPWAIRLRIIDPRGRFLSGPGCGTLLMSGPWAPGPAHFGDPAIGLLHGLIQNGQDPHVFARSARIVVLEVAGPRRRLGSLSTLDTTRLNIQRLVSLNWRVFLCLPKYRGF